MAETHETVADIIAEIRALSNPISDGIIAINGRSIADRLEAAHKREAAFHAMTCEANDRLREHLRIALDANWREHGDTAKLRGALTKILDLTNSLDEECAVDPVEIRDIAKVALAAPPRNCDIYKTKEKAQEAFMKEPCDHPCGNCWVEDINNECGVDWLFSTATEKEGGEK